MTASDFVQGLRDAVLDAAVSDTMEVVARPPGRHPPADLLELSRWFNRLGDADRAMVEALLRMVARQSVFGLLSVLDGTRTLESSVGPKGYFDLKYVKNGKEHILSGPRGKILHELLV